MTHNQHYYELVYHDGMTHSSYNYDLIKEIWDKDKDLVSHIEIRDSTQSRGKGFQSLFADVRASVIPMDMIRQYRVVSFCYQIIKKIYLVCSVDALLATPLSKVKCGYLYVTKPTKRLKNTHRCATINTESQKSHFFGFLSFLKILKSHFFNFFSFLSFFNFKCL